MTVLAVTQERSASVAAASEQASSNVQSVASATEQLGSSVNEISRQVQESSRIAIDAVKQAEKTDGRIVQLSRSINCRAGRCRGERDARGDRETCAGRGRRRPPRTGAAWQQ